ncbi:anti-sigma-28 factor, FlgM family [Clostridium cavendishii DSM 21758]|uniref:Negative regulator of flagellin synthesis n=1 Tax=Clostridium cavendishii DSM 21758 TaxID=1121302 RepID=A0A1M6B4C7_9CLOT|nr:flagellar biosynthesis anti-sigma factor FlgM [Clostridium cavendishii]SHI43599.1 anti-sigma-28 factor, FlgM family [Clostridium cavendishii DSM 21758]
MNIRGIGGTSNVINLYNRNTNKVGNAKEVSKRDSVEISNVGKVLMSYGIEEPNVANNKRIEELRQQVQNGTYKVDSTLTAKALIDTMRGRRV